MTAARACTQPLIAPGLLTAGAPACRRAAAASAASPACRPPLLQRRRQAAGILQPKQQAQQLGAQRRRQAAVAAAAPAAAPAAAAAAQAFWPALVQAWNTSPAAVMMGAGAAILGVALSIFLLASIPTMLALRRSAHAMESLLLTVQAELPDTAATLRLSGVELADTIQELGALGSDLTAGVRASARAVASAEQGLRQGADLAGRAMAEHVLPQARDRVETALQERARLQYTREVLQQTRSAAQRLRFALAGGALARGVLQSVAAVRRPPARSVGGGSADELGV